MKTIECHIRKSPNQAADHCPSQLKLRNKQLLGQGTLQNYKKRDDHTSGQSAAGMFLYDCKVWRCRTISQEESGTWLSALPDASEKREQKCCRTMIAFVPLVRIEQKRLPKTDCQRWYISHILLSAVRVCDPALR